MTLKSRTPAKLAADARAAYAQLTEHRPDGIGDDALDRHLTVLAARMNDHHTSNTQLAAAMDPPLSMDVFGARLRRAIEVAGVIREPVGRRTTAQLSADARAAHEQLTARRPDGCSDDVYQRYLAVLVARIHNPGISSAQLAAAMDPPMSKDKFNALFYRAVRASVRKERLPGPPKPHGIPGPNAARQATDAAEAFAVLRAHRPDRLTDDRYVQLLTVLAVRMDNPTMTYRQLGTQLDPPLTAGGFYAALRHAHDLADVEHTFTPHSRRAAQHQQDAAA